MYNLDELLHELHVNKLDIKLSMPGCHSNVLILWMSFECDLKLSMPGCHSNVFKNCPSLDVI